MHQIKSVAVYCGSAEHVDPRYYDATAELGQILAEEGIRLIYGGGGIGLMGALANASLKSGGEVIGISTELLYALEGLRIGQPKLSELHIVSTMHERKCMMFDRSDGFIILPGGLGTLEEAFEVLTWRQLGLHFKPIVFLNTSNYWDPLLNHLLSHMINEGFVRSIDRQLFRFCNHPVDILRALRK
jgi:uncharacterized protein (TIGR00730 family)